MTVIKSRLLQAKVVRKTGYANNFTDENLLQWIEDEWADFPATLRHNKRWKIVNHLGNANLMPFGGIGRSLGTIVIEWRDY